MLTLREFLAMSLRYTTTKLTYRDKYELAKLYFEDQLIPNLSIYEPAVINTELSQVEVYISASMIMRFQEGRRLGNPNYHLSSTQQQYHMRVVQADKHEDKMVLIYRVGLAKEMIKYLDKIN